MVEPVDVSKKHFYISLVKSFIRFGAGGALIWGGMVSAWAYNPYPLMFAGGLLIIAEILGIAEEL
jgi:hypothetical protein